MLADRTLSDDCMTQNSDVANSDSCAGQVLAVLCNGWCKVGVLCSRHTPDFKPRTAAGSCITLDIVASTSLPRVDELIMALSCAQSRSVCASRAAGSARSAQIARRVVVRAEAPAKVTAGPVTDNTWEAEVGGLDQCCCNPRPPT
jgi:hypothetical protein